MSDNTPNCELCGEPMPAGETMFKYHGYSGPCPKPHLPRVPKPNADQLQSRLDTIVAECRAQTSGAVEDKSRDTLLATIISMAEGRNG